MDDRKFNENHVKNIVTRFLDRQYKPDGRGGLFRLENCHYDLRKVEIWYQALAFAANSSHQAEYCIKLVNKMQFKSEENSSAVKNDDAKLVFYDIEVFPNLFLVNWKIEGEGKPVVRMINPTPTEIEELIQLRLVGFNCRRYDNHIMYGQRIR